MKHIDGSATSEGNSLTCKWDGCEKRWIGQRYCINHYQQARKLGIIQNLPERPHRLSDVDTEALTARCSDCGEGVPVLRQSRAYACRTWTRARGKAAYQRNIEKRRNYHREYNRAYRFGWTVEEMDALLDRTDLACEVCAKPLTKKQARLDHDHSCCPHGKGCGMCFRGILCNSCNTAIGALKEDPAIFAAALAYLAKSRKAA